ncbi:MAG: Cof-type HAD-IIB family hydrolase [Firmicutes bacterium]|nr:Cof-type HAD-IIB family hydrolase [Bacillota bacterium]
MEKYLIALDLDGTLLYDFDTVSNELATFMKEIQKDGHKIVIATGRPFRSSSFVYDLFNLDTPIINYNGGLITHPLDKSFKIVNYTVKKEAIIDIFENNIEHIRNAFSEVKDTIYLYQEEKEIEPLLHRMSTSPVYLGHLKDTLKEDPNGFIIIGKQGHGKAIEKYVNEHYQGSVLSRIWDLKGEFDSIVEIFTPESNKGKGLKYVSEYLNIPRERVLAIGDGHNDIEMLEFASLGVAVKNAHPELLEVADVILEETSKEDAVKKFLTKYLKK